MNRLVQKYPILGSSVDPAKLAITVKGVIIGLASILVIAGVDVSGLDLTGLAESAYNAITAIGLAVSACMTAYGFGRKVFFWAKEKYFNS